ncbi:MAG: OmpA family protein [Planctomycetes bacterium]|nr:OmpA family protein [Planctomycetota bacterium]
MAKKKAPEDPPMGAPLYMVSFGDMITILLTFFILLCSYATERQSGFVSDGIGSFRTAINNFGLPGIMPGDRLPIDLGAARVRYRPVGALNQELLESDQGVVDDLNRDALRDVVKNALQQDQVSTIPATFLFEPGVITLSQDHRAALDVIAPLIAGKNLKLRIEGYAIAEGKGLDERKIAAQRTFAFADYLVREHGLERREMDTVAYGSGGSSNENRKNRIVQEKLGRRIVYLTLVPRSK